MCAGAILQARLKRLVYGKGFHARRLRGNYLGSWLHGAAKRAPAPYPGARQPRLGADGSWISMFGSSHNPDGAESEGARQQSCQCDTGSSDPVQPKGPQPFHTSIAIMRGVMQEECAEVGMTGVRLLIEWSL